MAANFIDYPTATAAWAAVAVGLKAVVALPSSKIHPRSPSSREIANPPPPTCLTYKIVIPSNARDLGFCVRQIDRVGRTPLSVAFGFGFDLDSDREGHGLQPCRKAEKWRGFQPRRKAPQEINPASAAEGRFHPTKW